MSTSRLDLRSAWNFTGSERKFLGYECTAFYRSHAQSAAAGGEGDLTPGKITVSAGVVLGFSLISD